jgi:hypothetical protein
MHWLLQELGGVTMPPLCGLLSPPAGDATSVLICKYACVNTGLLVTTLVHGGLHSQAMHCTAYAYALAAP